MHRPDPEMLQALSQHCLTHMQQTPPGTVMIAADTLHEIVCAALVAGATSACPGVAIQADSDDDAEQLALQLD